MQDKLNRSIKRKLARSSLSAFLEGVSSLLDFSGALSPLTKQDVLSSSAYLDNIKAIRQDRERVMQNMFGDNWREIHDKWWRQYDEDKRVNHEK